MSGQPSGFVTIGDTHWPDPTDPRELAYRLRHHPDGLLRRDQLVLASIVEAYSSLVCMDSRTRQRRVMQLRDVSDVFRRLRRVPTCRSPSIESPLLGKPLGRA